MYCTFSRRVILNVDYRYAYIERAHTYYPYCPYILGRLTCKSHPGYCRESPMVAAGIAGDCVGMSTSYGDGNVRRSAYY